MSGGIQTRQEKTTPVAARRAEEPGAGLAALCEQRCQLLELLGCEGHEVVGGVGSFAFVALGLQAVTVGGDIGDLDRAVGGGELVRVPFPEQARRFGLALAVRQERAVFDGVLDDVRQQRGEAAFEAVFRQELHIGVDAHVVVENLAVRKHARHMHLGVDELLASVAGGAHLADDRAKQLVGDVACDAEAVLLVDGEAVLRFCPSTRFVADETLVDFVDVT